MSEAVVVEPELLSAGGVGLASGFCLDCAKLITEMLDEDLVPSVVCLGVLSANVARYDRAVTQDPGVAVHFNAIPREAVSIYRLARNLSIPYETTRRHAARLIAKGVCVRDGDGVTLAPNLFFMPRPLITAKEAWRLCVELRDNLEAMGLDAPPPPLEVDDHEKRRVGRLANDFFLAGLKIAVDATATDMVTALIFLAIARANQIEGPPNTILPDDRMKPVSVYALSRTMRVPYETVRRHVGILLGEGLCRKAPSGGLIVPLNVARSEPLLAASAQAWTLMSDFIAAAFGPGAARAAA